MNLLRRLLPGILLLGATTLTVAGDAPGTWGDWPRWGDQGDGTYRNPVLPADYSDLDCIRVGADYYAIPSTFQFSPGVVVLHSHDLVNWRIAGHVFTFNSTAEAGHVDVDWFHYDFAGPHRQAK